jgi:DNA recombination protein RmuC
MESLFVALIVLSFCALLLFLYLVLRPRTGSANERLLAISDGQERMERSIREELARFGLGSDRRLEALRETIDRKLREIQEDNAAKLESIRRTVDEKLHETLERRLGESFKLVGERLELVQAGLGEMRSLAAGVGDLKRVLVNVKNRGTWGEVQLISIVEDLLAPDQYALNVAVRSGAAERVEVAIKLPGRDADQQAPVWLPVDAKFPKEDYERLLEARERGDAPAAEEAAKLLERRFKLAAKDIRDKYLAPPETTDFAIMFLASEGLFAECLGRPGLSDFLQREYRVVVSGPTTLAAMLNSLQMGFHTLAVEKRTAEVWRTLTLVKAEFERFGELLDKTRKKLQEAADTVDLADRKTRTIRGKLNRIEGTEGAEEEDE